MNHFYHFVPLFAYLIDKVTETCFSFESTWRWRNSKMYMLKAKKLEREAGYKRPQSDECLPE